ncbi:MAG TPA: hypothetical protein VMU04_09575 [Candidatus Acidoferrum sp.]|nr:hypothetical protein [Candidatus Acidoferrum sp.]
MKIRDIPQSGSLGETVTYDSRYGQIRRQKTVPRNPRTAVQMGWRAAFQQARSFWGTLSDEQFLAWDVVGQARRTQAVLGRSGPISGYLVSVSVNAHLAMIGQPMVSAPPPIPVFPASPVVGLAITGAADALAMKLQLSGTPVGAVLVFGARPQSPGVRYVDHFPFLGVLPEQAGGEADITALYVARFGVPPAGKRVFVQTVQQINGWQDQPNTLSARVLAP